MKNRRGVVVFFSYSDVDTSVFNISKLAYLLEQTQFIVKVYYWERDATGSIIDYMNTKIAIADTCIFFYSKHTDEKSGVRTERDMAVYYNKHIIPVFKDIRCVPPIICFNSGIDVSRMTTSEIADKIKHLISLKFQV